MSKYKNLFLVPCTLANSLILGPFWKSLYIPDSSQGLVGVVGDRIGGLRTEELGRGWKGAGRTYFEHHLINNLKILEV